MEGIALYSGEAEEKGLLGHRFGSVIGNWWAIMQRTKMLNALTAGYDQVAVVFPFIVAAPRFFSGQIPLGGLTQTAGAFGRVQDALSWFISRYGDLAQWHAIVERLTTFHRAVVAARAAFGTGLTLADTPEAAVRLRDVTIELPTGLKLLTDADLVLKRGQSVIITGPSGSGKSTLFRALAGIWPFGHGSVERPIERCLFLPQRPYIPLGSLRHVVTYPYPPSDFSREDIAHALNDAGLAQLVPQIDHDENWAQRLSGGEQQRLAFARVLLLRPQIVFLDEATSALDEPAEANLYRLLRDAPWRPTIVSVGHHGTLRRFHDTVVDLTRRPVSEAVAD
jgi:putative ATP-binding cassette transporter